MKPPHGPHRGPHHPPHHGQPRGWIEYDRRDTTREEFGLEVQSLGELIAANNKITFGEILIALPEEVSVEQVFERNPHGNFVLRIHAEWPEFDTSRASARGRSPKFGPATSTDGE